LVVVGTRSLSSGAHSRDPVALPTPQKLRRSSRKHDLFSKLRQNNPTGKSVRSLSSPSRKNIPLPSSGKSELGIPPSCPAKRGVGRRHERWGRERWTLNARKTKPHEAYGEGVWS
jgi:hypothetical protein